MRKKTLAGVMTFAFWGIAVWGTTAWADLRHETLRGLAGVWVVVEKLHPDIDQGGVTRSQLQADAEARLRQAGLRVLTQDECWETPGMPWLYITAGILKATDTTYAVTIEASLHQEVILARAPHVKTFGVTWDTGVNIGVVGVGQMGTVREHVGALVDRFIADYRAANSQARGRYGVFRPSAAHRLRG